MGKHRDSIIGVVVIVLSAALFIASFFIREFTRSSIGAGFLPKITAIILSALGAVLIIRERRASASSSAPVRTEQAAAVERRGIQGGTAVILNILLFVAYLLLLETVGFVILTPIYIFFQILLLTDPAKYRLGWYALLSIIVGAASYYMFVNFFQVMLPNGILS